MFPVSLFQSGTFLPSPFPKQQFVMMDVILLHSLVWNVRVNNMKFKMILCLILNGKKEVQHEGQQIYQANINFVKTQKSASI